MPPTTTFAQPLTHLIVKLSKLVKEARQLGCETFSSIVDVMVMKKWLNRVLTTLIDIKLDDKLKMKVATRLINKSTVTW